MMVDAFFSLLQMARGRLERKQMVQVRIPLLAHQCPQSHVLPFPTLSPSTPYPLERIFLETIVMTATRHFPNDVFTHDPTINDIAPPTNRRNGPRLGRRPFRFRRQADIDARAPQLPPRTVAGIQRPARPAKVERHEQTGRRGRKTEVRPVAQETMKHVGRDVGWLCCVVCLCCGLHGGVIDFYP